MAGDSELAYIPVTAEDVTAAEIDEVIDHSLNRDRFERLRKVNPALAARILKRAYSISRQSGGLSEQQVQTEVVNLGLFVADAIRKAVERLTDPVATDDVGGDELTQRPAIDPQSDR